MTTADPHDDLRRLAPYLADLRQAAREEGIRLQVLCGVGLRETLVGWAPGYTPRGTHLGFGDRGYGFGLFQADLRTWEPALRGLIPGVDLLTPLGQARLAARHLRSSFQLLRAVFPALSEQLVFRASIAAYNARIGAVAGQLVAGADVDAVTTEGPPGPDGVRRRDYSADVLKRAARLEQRDHVLFPPAGG